MNWQNKHNSLKVNELTFQVVKNAAVASQISFLVLSHSSMFVLQKHDNNHTTFLNLFISGFWCLEAESCFHYKSLSENTLSCCSVFIQLTRNTKAMKAGWDWTRPVLFYCRLEYFLSSTHNFIFIVIQGGLECTREGAEGTEWIAVQFTETDVTWLDFMINTWWSIL